MPSSAVALRSSQPLTPAMVSAVWEIAAALDEQRVPANTTDAVWLNVPTMRLRGEGSRPDNVWLRQCLERLTGVKLSGEYRGDPWGAVVLAEWHITEGGSMAKLLIPPAGVHALRSPANFTRIEATAAHRLTGHGRQLYAILADKKRLGRPYWVFDLAELRALMGVDDKSSYDRWSDFRTRVINPAVEAINDYGTVSVKMVPEKRGRSVHAVRFEWNWKDPHEAAETTVENERHSKSRRKTQDSADAPPLTETAEGEHQPDAAAWWEQLSEADREAWRDKVGRFITGEDGDDLQIAGKPVQRRESDIAILAYERAVSDETQS